MFFLPSRLLSKFTFGKKPEMSLYANMSKSYTTAFCNINLLQQILYITYTWNRNTWNRNTSTWTILNINSFLIPLQVSPTAHLGNVYDLLYLQYSKLSSFSSNTSSKIFNQSPSLIKQPIKSVTRLFPYATVLIGISSIYQSSSTRHLKLLNYMGFGVRNIFI